ncbi:MAG: DUF1295 domain-containing protein [Acidilobaceae archaeon]
MKTSRATLVASALLSALLTVTLFYLTFEIPLLLDEALRQYLPEAFFSVLRPLGYISLTLTLVAIIAGFLAKSRFLAFLGSLTMYLPTFAYFAYAMFLLPGLGALGVLWLPILESYPLVLKLGHAVFLPFLFTPAPYASLAGAAIIATGLLIFSLATTTWLYGRFRGYELVDFWVYKYSRHPQYLGFLLWSYGLVVFAIQGPYPKGALSIPPTFIWLVVAATVGGIALLEELEMVEKHGEKYREYREKTPFMVPLPKPLVAIIMLPARVVGGYPKRVRDVVVIVALYTAILALLSYVLVTILEL